MTSQTAPLNYQLRRSNRAKKTRIVVTHDRIEVVAPHDVPEQRIRAFVTAQRDWIDAARRRIADRARQIPTLAPAHYASGAKIPYQGRLLTLGIEPQNIKTMRIRMQDAERLIIYLPRSMMEMDHQRCIKQALESWMKQQARQYATTLIERHAPTFDLQPRSLRIKTQKSRWGSCGPKNDINLNWLLILAPPSIIEYVVVHELCHIRHKNHSKDFWQLVAAHLPDYLHHREWLKRHGTQLMQGL